MTYNKPPAHACTQVGDLIAVDLHYPRMQGNAKGVLISLTDVRAASNLLIYYDFTRNGWVATMDAHVERDGHMERVRECDEVAFIPAWNIAK